MKKYYEKPVCGIYRISHRDSEKSYVGQSKDIFNRWKSHSNFARKKLSYISSALKLYGLESFRFEVIEECSLEELNGREVYWISYFNCLSPNGYNLTSGGGQGTTLSEETRNKISESNKKAQKGKIFSKEHGQKISKALKGRTISEDWKKKLSEAAKSQKRNPMSEEQKKKISEAAKNRRRLRESEKAQKDSELQQSRAPNDSLDNEPTEF